MNSCFLIKNTRWNSPFFLFVMLYLTLKIQLFTVCSHSLLPRRWVVISIKHVFKSILNTSYLVINSNPTSLTKSAVRCFVSDFMLPINFKYLQNISMSVRCLSRTLLRINVCVIVLKTYPRNLTIIGECLPHMMATKNTDHMMSLFVRTCQHDHFHQFFST